MNKTLVTWRKHILAQFLIMAASWASLVYGWGMTIERWYVVMAYGIFVAVSLAPLNAWISRSDNHKES